MNPRNEDPMCYKDFEELNPEDYVIDGEVTRFEDGTSRRTVGGPCSGTMYYDEYGEEM